MGEPHLSLSSRRFVERALQLGLLMMVLVSSSGCGVIEQFIPSQISQPNAPAAPAVEAPPVQPPASTYTPEPTYTSEPTYTLEPTYTPFPTYTPLPTYTLPPTFTPLPVVVILPSPFVPSSTPLSSISTYTLRVRNRSKHTLWIGTVMPWGGNYIEPLKYVEFYLHKPTWMRIWWCRYRWSKDDLWYEEGLWKSDNLYDCQHTDVYIDVSLKEISVK